MESPGNGWARGVPSEYLRQLSAYWLTEYDWREHEERFNRHPQFTTSIDGQTIHFLRVRRLVLTTEPKRRDVPAQGSGGRLASQ